MKRTFLIKLDDKTFGKLGGKTAILPTEIFVETGLFANGTPTFSKHCLIHQVPIPDQGCTLCKEGENK